MMKRSVRLFVLLLFAGITQWLQFVNDQSEFRNFRSSRLNKVPNKWLCYERVLLLRNNVTFFPDCRLPTADCRLPAADSRFPKCES